MENPYQADIEAILARRHDNGGDLWATPDKRLLKGSPYSTVDCAMYLLELGLPPDAPALKAVADLIFSTWRPDGRFRIYPDGSIYPCHTAIAANVLSHLGHADDVRMQQTFRHLLGSQQLDGGWRCSKFPFGHGPETECANPGPTLIALDAFRFSDTLSRDPALDRAVHFLLGHWVIRKPIGPCHYGIGTLFMQVEYPFRSYNLFYYVHVLSFYKHARQDWRFLEAFAALAEKTHDGQIVVERVVPKLARLSFCRKGEPSELGTRRYREILDNLGQGQQHH